MPLEPGQTILNGKYRIVRLIGEGGMARVWLVEELTFGNRLVAIKELRTDLPPDEQQDVQRRYQREVRVCAALEQARVPNIVRAITAEPYGDIVLLTMEHMCGGDLAGLLKEFPSGMPLERALAIAREVLRALQGAHEHSLEIVHRDIKPSNILFNGDGQACLGDFGLAQMAGMSQRSQLRGEQHPGTPLYMAPEQEMSTSYLSPGADLFALGCVLFEMLTGRRYKRMRPGTKPSAVQKTVPLWLDEVVARALAADAWDRWETAREFEAALRRSPAGQEEWSHAIQTRQNEIVAPPPPEGQLPSGKGKTLEPSDPLAPVQPGQADLRSQVVLSTRTPVGLATADVPPVHEAKPSFVQEVKEGRGSGGTRGESALDPTAPRYAVITPHNARRMVRLRRDSVEGLQSLAASPVVRHLAVGTARGVELRDLDNLQAGQLDRIALPGAPFLAFRPDGQALAIALPNGQLCSWLLGGTRSSSHLASRGSLTALAFSPDGQLLAYGSPDGMISLWRFPYNTVVRTIEAHHGSVSSLAFSPNGRVLASGSISETVVRLWSLSDGLPVDILGSHGGGVSALAFSPDGRSLACGSWDDREIRLWRLGASRSASTLRGLGKNVSGLAFAPSGQLLASVSEGDAVRLWQVDDGALLQTTGERLAVPKGLAFSPSGDLLVSASGDGALHQWGVRE